MIVLIILYKIFKYYRVVLLSRYTCLKYYRFWKRFSQKHSFFLVCFFWLLTGQCKKEKDTNITAGNGISLATTANVDICSKMLRSIFTFNVLKLINANARNFGIFSGHLVYFNHEFGIFWVTGVGNPVYVYGPSCSRIC